jgi:hypothetical protein
MAKCSKLGIDVSQATVGRYMIRRHGPPSSTWRTFLRNQIDGIVAIDMFLVITAAFRPCLKTPSKPKTQEFSAGASRQMNFPAPP